MGVSRYVVVIFGLCVITSVASAGVQDPLDGAISAWAFEGGMTDLFGGNDGTVQGDATFSAGKYGLALDVDGTDAWAEVAHDASMNGMADALTAAVWSRTRSHNGSDFEMFMWKGEKVGWAAGFLFQLGIRSPGGNTSWGISTNDVEGWFHSKEELLDDWHHAAIVADGQDLYAYWDGTPIDVVGGHADFGGAAAAPLPLAGPYALFPDQPIRFGLGQGIGGDVNNKTYYNGLVDDAIIYDRALSQSEVQALMATDLSTMAAIEPRGKLAATWGRLKYD
jgi:hypothetical protein